MKRRLLIIALDVVVAADDFGHRINLPGTWWCDWADDRMWNLGEALYGSPSFRRLQSPHSGEESNVTPLVPQDGLYLTVIEGQKEERVRRFTIGLVVAAAAAVVAAAVEILRRRTL